MAGRNAPCPCGSGRRFKHCHGAGRAERGPGESAASPLHVLDRILVERLMRYAFDRFGERWLQSGRAFADPDAVMQLSGPWSVYHFPVGGKSAAEWLLADPAERLSAEERAWLEAQRASWLSVWEVQAVTPGIDLTLKDQLTGATRLVLETLGSRQLVPGDAMLARVVDHAGISVLVGSHPRILPPVEAAEVVKTLRRRLRRKSPVPAQRLRAESVERLLIASWEDEIAMMTDRATRRPELTNTDGDELLLTVDHFAVAPGRRAEVSSRVAKLRGIEPANPGDPGDPWTFVRARDHTVLGAVRLDRTGLRLETNSIERADTLRARLEKACGGLITHRAREHSSAFAPPSPGKIPRGSSARDAQLPKEVEERMVRKFLDRHYATWPDYPLPALDGLTPREAVGTAEGRERVRTLLKSFDHHAARAPGPAPDTDRIRRELGLLDSP